MAFLRTLFWIALTVMVVVFSVRNWASVPVNLFGDTVVETKLPVLLLIAFLAGFVPLYIWHRATKWRLARKMTTLERAPSSPVAPNTPPFVTPNQEPAQAD
jgi:uncharacterized integral membrane protein